AERIAEQPDYFAALSKLQTPEFFWIGCSDSRVPANVITGLAPGEVFVHRNVANLVHRADINVLSTLQFAVEVLKVRHVIVCGHYGCGGVHAAVDGRRHGLIDYWLRPIQEIATRHAAELEPLDAAARHNRLCELNVVDQVRSVCETPIVLDAWARGQDLSVHGWCYGLDDGRIRDLHCTRASA
ncbi:MAG: carbonic anhydrase, partial [Alphaproteobacteria bacterium]|nr:carbonic anhydrase [Alphaproteobacteria bacterium]MDX5370777.1 carbonic anhydrase [Alphaproteobacteria bacterium]MDX5465189.1 carbonic anhydrase [Alphaproteobacteria bacterium]